MVHDGGCDRATNAESSTESILEMATGNIGNSSSSSLPICGHWAPWPVKTKA